MMLSDRLRVIRQQKKLSQGDMERRTGLLRCYISRIENGHTVPEIETLQRLAHALEVPLYQLFYDGEKPPEPINVLREVDRDEWAAQKSAGPFMRKLCRCLGRMEPKDRELVLVMASRMSRPRRRKPVEAEKGKSTDGVKVER